MQNPHERQPVCENCQSFDLSRVLPKADQAAVGKEGGVTKYPKNPDMMKRRQERMAALGLMSRIPAMLVFESKINLKAYYGTYFRAGLVLIWESIWFGSHSVYWHFIYRFCDLVGWTKIRETNIRHGGKCTYLNCSDFDCIDKGIPKWFRKLSGMAKNDL